MADDPVFAAILVWRQARHELDQAIETWLATYSTADRDTHLKREAIVLALSPSEETALLAVYATQPTSIAGLAALLDIFREAEADFLQPAQRQAIETMAMSAEALASAAGKPAI